MAKIRDIMADIRANPKLLAHEQDGPRHEIYRFPTALKPFRRFSPTLQRLPEVETDDAERFLPGEKAQQLTATLLTAGEVLDRTIRAQLEVISPGYDWKIMTLAEKAAVEEKEAAIHLLRYIVGKRDRAEHLGSFLGRQTGKTIDNKLALKIYDRCGVVSELDAADQRLLAAAGFEATEVEELFDHWLEHYSIDREKAGRAITAVRKKTVAIAAYKQACREHSMRYRAILCRELSRLRPLGIEPEQGQDWFIPTKMDGTEAEAIRQAAIDGAAPLPRSWLEQARLDQLPAKLLRTDRGPLKLLGKIGLLPQVHGAYDYRQEQIMINSKIFGRPEVSDTLRHETIHRCEATRPELKIAEFAYYQYRSRDRSWSKPLRTLRKKGLGCPWFVRDDRLHLPFSQAPLYHMRTYGGRPDSHYELLSKGIDMLFNGELEADSEYRSWLLGTLAAL